MSQKSVKELFQDGLIQFQNLESSTQRQDSEEFQQELTKAIELWISLKRVVQQLSLFSANESLEDLNTSEIKYLAIDYYMSQLYTQLLKPSKIINLKKAVILNVQFLRSLNDYSLLDKSQSTKYENLKESPLDMKIVMRETTITDREEKIGLFKLSRSLTTKLEYLEKLESNSEEYEKVDEETIRSLYLQQLQLFSIKSFENLKLIAQELEILESFEKSANKIQEIDDDDEPEKDPTGFTDKLEFINKDLLSKEGKILQPFTIVKRADLKKKVFGTGQYLPTMTVEEFLEQELANGGMVSGGGEVEDQSEDEDDYEKNDRETYKKREWDEFTESHAKGSGNTINRG